MQSRDRRAKSYEDVQPKASVAANTGAGPDLFWGLYSLPHLFPQKCVDVTDVADYLGKKYGGWVAERGRLRQERQQVDRDPDLLQRQHDELPHLGARRRRASRNSRTTTDEFLEYAKATKRNNTPGGFALGHASGDGNSWVHWCLWAHGGNVVDKNDKVIINSPETAKALEYAKQLYEQHDSRHRVVERRLQQQGVPGRRNPLDQQRHLDLRRRHRRTPTKKEIAEDMDHALVAGRPGRQADRAPL